MRKRLFHSFVSLSVLWFAICLYDVVDASDRNTKTGKGSLIANSKRKIRTSQQQALLRAARQAVKTEEPANTVVTYMRDHKISSGTLFAIEKDLPNGFKIIREKKNGKDSIRLTYVQHDELHAQDRSSSSFSSTKEVNTNNERAENEKQTDTYDLNSTLRLQDMQNLVRIVLNDTNGMRSDLIMIIDLIKNIYSDVNSLRTDIPQMKNKLKVIEELKARFEKESKDLRENKYNENVIQKLETLDSKIAKVGDKVDTTNETLSSLVVDSGDDIPADYIEFDTEHRVDETLEHKTISDDHPSELGEHVDEHGHIGSAEHKDENSEQSGQESSSAHTEEKHKEEVADYEDVDNEEKASDVEQHDLEVREEGNAEEASAVESDKHNDETAATDDAEQTGNASNAEEEGPSESSVDEDMKERKTANEDAQRHVDETEASVKSEVTDEYTNDSENDASNSNDEDATYKKFIERRKQEQENDLEGMRGNKFVKSMAKYYDDAAYRKFIERRKQEREAELKNMQGNKIVKSMAKDYGELKDTSSETDNGINKKTSETSEYNERKMKNDEDAAYKKFIERRKQEREAELKSMSGNKIVKSMVKDYGELKDTSSETDNGINKKSSETSEYNERKMKDAAE